MKLMIILGLISALFGCSSSEKPENNDTIVHFSLSEGGGMNRLQGFNYTVDQNADGTVSLCFNEGFPDERKMTIDDRAVFDGLQQVVMKYKMYRYRDHYRPMMDVTDGMSWDLYVRYASGKSISSGGYMAGPDDYRKAFAEIDSVLKPWKDLPVEPVEVLSFVYEYGPDHYAIEREGDHALLIHDNAETGEHEVLTRKLLIFEDLRVFFIVERLKMNETRGNLNFEHTPWLFDITYSNGEHYRYESYDRDFKCGYTHILQSFIYGWMQKDKEYISFY